MIKTLIDSLSYSKLNVFHWHLTDTQSFPLYLDSLPMFAEYGAYSPEMTYNKVRHTLTSDLSDTKLVLQKVPSELHPKVRNHGEGLY